MARTGASTFRLPRLGGRALALLYIGVALLPLLPALGRQAAPLDPWERVGAGLGLAALTAMAIQFVTSGRFAIVSAHLGIDRIMAFHKIAAWWVLLALVLHPVFYVLPTWLDDPELGMRRLVAYHLLPQYRTGVIALAALALLVAGVLVAVIGTLYGWRWISLHWRPWELRSVTRLADRIWELEIQPKPGTPDLGYEAGQFVWMTEGPRRFPLFDHPFSIADSPERPGISLIVKEAGDFTGRIGALPPGTPIGIDGPYGDFTLAEHSDRAVLLVAGGVGIGPIMGLLRDLVARRDPRPVRLAHAVGQPANFACLDEIDAARAVLDLEVMLLSETAGVVFSGEIGRLDPARIARLLDGLDPERTVAMMCGPGPMVAAVSDMLGDHGLPLDRIVYERFDYATGAASRQDRRRLAQMLGVGVGVAAASRSSPGFRRDAVHAMMTAWSSRPTDGTTVSRCLRPVPRQAA